MATMKPAVTSRPAVLYRGILWSSFVLLLGAFYAARIHGALPKLPEGLNPATGILAYSVAEQFANVCCRVLGISQESKEVVRYARSATAAVVRPELDNNEAVKYRPMSPGAVKFVIGSTVLLVSSCSYLTVLWIIDMASHSSTRNMWMAPVGLLLFGCSGLLVWTAGNKSYVLADVKGVYAILSPTKYGQVTWEQIQSCEVTVKRNVLGIIKSMRVTIKDESGTEIGRVNLDAIPEEARQQFLRRLISRASLERVTQFQESQPTMASYSSAD